MKIRMGFVSNSSTTSFLCQVCGEISAERDCSMNELGVYECENGHVCCQSHIPPELVDEFENRNDDEYSRCEDVPAKFCLICKFEAMSDKLLVTYMEKKFNVSREELLVEIKRHFIDYHDFHTFLSGGPSPILGVEDKKKAGTRLFRCNDEIRRCSDDEESEV